jgi:hypothetical protein
MNEFIIVPVVSKTGKDLGEVRLNLSRVLYFREWKESNESESKEIKLVAFLDGGKELVLKLDTKELDDRLNEKKLLHNNK